MDITELDDGREKSRARLTRDDWQQVADYVCDTLDQRKNERKDLEKDWKEIDRQLRMEPDLGHKMVDGQVPKELAWIPETELPLQSQTLEVLSADARRMLAADPWFEAHAAMTDEYSLRVDFDSIVAGDDNDVPSVITQDNADKLVQGAINYWADQYDFWGNVDLVNTDAFKYGAGVAVCRPVNKSVLKLQGRGVVRKSEIIPALIPRSIKKTYLDNTEHAVMNEGVILGPLQLYCYQQKWDDLVLAATRGETNPDVLHGGWMPKSLKGLDPDENRHVEIIEAEGDFVVPRKTRSSYVIPSAIITVVKAKTGENTAARVVRVRFVKNGQSHIVFPYHHEHVDSIYPTSPLMKGWPIQKAAVDALNRFLMVAALHGGPPVQFDRDDAMFAQEGGPRVHPYAQWPTTGDVKLHTIGDPAALFNAYVGLLQQYADVTGVNAPRLGAQTVSHTTAFAKEAEMSRGTIRTVDYVNSTLAAPMVQWLHKAFEIGRDNLRETTIWLKPYRGFVTINKKHLPDMVQFEAHGSGGPSEEQAKMDRRLSALQMVLNIDQLAMQQQASGLPATLDYDKIKQQVLSDGGWTDIDAFLAGEGADQGVAVQPGMDGAAQAGVIPAGAAVQALALAQR